VYDILKDSAGFMWFATGNGLNRYDGYSFQVFTADEYDSISISDNVCISVEELDADHLIVGTASGGVNILNKPTNTFRRYFHDPDDSTSISNNRVSTILWNGLVGNKLRVEPVST
jgi:hypothetical protein